MAGVGVGWSLHFELPMPLLTASLVCYKTPVAELESLFRLLRDSLDSRITWVMVDNAAEEDAAAAGPLQAAVERHGGRYLPSANVGFGAAHNLALRALDATDAAYHLMVNPDILFEADVLAELLRVMDERPEVVRVMPRVRFPDGREQHLCKLLPTPADFALRRFLPGALQGLVQGRLDRYELKGLGDGPSTAVPFLSGCFVLARWSVLRAIGGFDDRYFLYMEDVDLCRRMRTHGPLLYWPAVHVTHGYHRGSHVSTRLMLAHLRSCVTYYNKWGWFRDADGQRVNRAALDALAASCDAAAPMLDREGCA